MIVSVIAAVGANYEIGTNNSLPWGKLPRDLTYFRQATKGAHLLMGKNTALSLPGPLSGRICHVLTHHPEELPLGFHPCKGVLDWLAELSDLEQQPEKVFVMGGSAVYQQALELRVVHELLLTRVEGGFPLADAFFPADTIDWDVWERLSCEDHRIDPDHVFNLSFEVWRQKK